MTHAEFIINLAKSQGKEHDAYKAVRNCLKASGYFYKDKENLKKTYEWKLPSDIADLSISILENLGYSIIKEKQSNYYVTIKFIPYQYEKGTIIDDNFKFANIFNAYTYLIKPQLLNSINPDSFVPDLENNYHVQIFNIHNEQSIYKLQKMISKEELLTSKYIRDDVVKIFNSEYVNVGNIFINYRFNKENIIYKRIKNNEYHKFTTCLTVDISICPLLESLRRMSRELTSEKTWLDKFKHFFKF